MITYTHRIGTLFTPLRCRSIYLCHLAEFEDEEFPALSCTQPLKFVLGDYFDSGCHCDPFIRTQIRVAAFLPAPPTTADAYGRYDNTNPCTFCQPWYFEYLARSQLDGTRATTLDEYCIIATSATPCAGDQPSTTKLSKRPCHQTRRHPIAHDVGTSTLDRIADFVALLQDTAPEQARAIRYVLQLGPDVEHTILAPLRRLEYKGKQLRPGRHLGIATHLDETNPMTTRLHLCY
jgi:hypothetical protein